MNEEQPGGTTSKNWFARHKILTGIMVVILFLIVLGMIGSGTSEPRKVGENTPLSVNTEAPAPEVATETAPSVTKTYKVGEQVESKGFVFVVNGTRKDTGSGFIKPEAGNVYLIPNVTIENKGAERTTISSLLQMYVKDSEGNKYTPTLTQNATGKVDGELLGGEKIKGDVGFEVPTTATGLKLYFQADWLFGGTIVVDLGI